MFTGLIQTQGTIRHLEQQGDLLVEIKPLAEDFPLSLGASIACHGVCLTVTHVTPDNGFTAQLSAETLRVTNAGRWRVGMKLNLEASLKLGDVLGGHIVSGHVDGLAAVLSKTPSGDSTVWEFEVPSELAPFIAPKGSVAVDGVSLTVNQVTGNRFTVNIIPHTHAVTGFATLQVGDAVNLEVDPLARYVARMLEFRA
jgi:riboflavin synthase